MRITKHPAGVYGSGTKINLTGDEVAMAIDAFLVARGITVIGPRTITVNDNLCEHGVVYVDPSGRVQKDIEK